MLSGQRCMPTNDLYQQFTIGGRDGACWAGVRECIVHAISTGLRLLRDYAVSGGNDRRLWRKKLKIGHVASQGFYSVDTAW